MAFLGTKWRSIFCCKCETLDPTGSKLERLPDFVCTQSIERFSRIGAEKPWEKIDSLRFDVALVGNQKLYALPGERQFRGRRLAEFAGRGSIGTGQLALLAKRPPSGAAIACASAIPNRWSHFKVCSGSTPGPRSCSGWRSRRTTFRTRSRWRRPAPRLPGSAYKCSDARG